MRELASGQLGAGARWVGDGWCVARGTGVRGAWGSQVWRMGEVWVRGDAVWACDLRGVEVTGVLVVGVGSRVYAAAQMH